VEHVGVVEFERLVGPLERDQVQIVRKIRVELSRAELHLAVADGGDRHSVELTRQEGDDLTPFQEAEADGAGFRSLHSLTDRSFALSVLGDARRTVLSVDPGPAFLELLNVLFGQAFRIDEPFLQTAGVTAEVAGEAAEAEQGDEDEVGDADHDADGDSAHNRVGLGRLTLRHFRVHHHVDREARLRQHRRIQDEVDFEKTSLHIDDALFELVALLIKGV